MTAKHYRSKRLRHQPASPRSRIRLITNCAESRFLIELIEAYGSDHRAGFTVLDDPGASLTTLVELTHPSRKTLRLSLTRCVRPIREPGDIRVRQNLLKSYRVS